MLTDDEITTLDGLRVTTPLRTLVDLAAGAARAVRAGGTGARELEQMVARADRAGLLEDEDVELALRRYAGRAGSAVLRPLLVPGAAAFTRSELEERFLTLIRRAQLPEPSTNVRVAGLEVDALWRAEGLIAEMDGFGFHRGRQAFERDRQRDAILLAAGYRVIRLTWTELTTHDLTVVTRLAQALAWAERAAHQALT